MKYFSMTLIFYMCFGSILFSDLVTVVDTCDSNVIEVYRYNIGSVMFCNPIRTDC